jgi:hypothetical protein
MLLTDQKSHPRLPLVPVRSMAELLRRPLASSVVLEITGGRAPMDEGTAAKRPGVSSPDWRSQLLEREVSHDIP